ncbi:MAG: trypsin-like peptidase domain-containing protein [Gemmatimonadota bacterium]|nr:trypsin-like peptidase domain-containing protein [Gemmatimonadota bacterium]
MSVEFRITRGARAGTVERFEKSVVTIGRHPMNDLRFDAVKDLDVSSRHAELRSVGNRHVLHDIGSTNGTYVNGQRIIAECQLADGDIVGFGADGPQLSFHVLEVLPEVAPPVEAPWVPAARAGERPRTPPGQSPQPRPPGARAAPPGPPPPPASSPSRGARTVARDADRLATRVPGPDRPRRNTEVRIAEAVKERTSRLRRVIVLLLALVVVGGGATAWVLVRTAAAARDQIARLLAANDSLARTLEHRLAQTGLADSALRAARAESERLASALRARQQSGGDVAALTAEMRRSQTRTANIAGMDYSAVTEANRPGVVFIAVEMPDKSASSGTGFNILPTGLIVTNRHVVETRTGTRAQRVAVAFDGTRGAWITATIEYVSDTDELALLRLTRPGTYPTVSGIARDGAGIRIGAPVAIIGYPLGTSTAGMSGGIDDLRPVATLGVGTVSKTLEETLQLDTYAAQGSSGSPVFDARGLVVGVLFGAAAESNGRLVYAVPSARLAAQLPTDAAGAVR